MNSTVSSRGQITLPARLREQLGLRTGTIVEFELLKNGLLIKKSSRGKHPVDRAFGSINLAAPVDTLLDKMRGPRSRKQRR